jgi:hypothetical protein
MHVIRYERRCRVSPARMVPTLCLFIFCSLMAMASDDGPGVQIDTSEAEAVLEILDVRHAYQTIDNLLWQRLFTTEGYRRLKQREASMNSAFTDDEFRTFVLSPDILKRREALRETLATWSKIDPTASTKKALRYLPPGAIIRATIYPTIKPRTNSFVFDLDRDPAIFFYIDPDKSSGAFENTMAHELHHVGYVSACPEEPEPEVEDERVAAVKRWSGAFGEGFAMLAAAGGPEVHPHAESPPADRQRWDRDMAGFNRDLKRVEQFFLDILNGKLESDEDRLEMARSFYGVQGPWYTVGWKMAVTVEKEFGRQRLISVLCEPADIFALYNDAAPEGSARWSPALLGRL